MGEVEWEGEATCYAADGTALGAKTVTGVYKSAGYSDISYSKSDGVCNGDRYCQPDLAQISAQIHISTDEILQRNYLWSALEHACDPAQGGVDCANLPHQCADNQESMARWVYSKYFIQKCEGSFDIHNPCTCEFPIYPYGPDDRIASAGLTWADTNACTYGLPGSYGYDDIPSEDKVPRSYDSLAATYESDRILLLQLSLTSTDRNDGFFQSGSNTAVTASVCAIAPGETQPNGKPCGASCCRNKGSCVFNYDTKECFEAPNDSCLEDDAGNVCLGPCCDAKPVEDNCEFNGVVRQCMKRADT